MPSADPATGGAALNTEPLVDLALQAGEVILRVYAEAFAVEVKSDASPVTEADRLAEAVILQGLRRLAPDIPIVAEEECSAGRVPDAAKRFFLVDPLDGTREFVSRNGEFTVNIALVEDGVPVLGIVYAPVQGLAYAGSAEGAFEISVASGRVRGRRAIRVRPMPADGLVAIGSRSHGGEATARWLERANIRDFRPSGSSLKFCCLAAGEADIYPRLGPTMEWDTAAGDAVLRAAGGLVVAMAGGALRYGKRDEDYRNPHFLAVGDRSLVELLDLPGV
jgi:3'(2'),5'-bisphosphate nucleotidase